MLSGIDWALARLSTTRVPLLFDPLPRATTLRPVSQLGWLVF